MAAVADQILEATTTPEVIQEFVHVRAKRRSRADAVRRGEEWAQLLSPLTTVSEETLASGLRIFAQTARLGSFDAVLAAAALERSAAALISADTSFADVAGLRHVAPDAHGIDLLLASGL